MQNLWPEPENRVVAGSVPLAESQTFGNNHPNIS